MTELTEFQLKCKAVSHYRDMVGEEGKKPDLNEIELKEELPDRLLRSLYGKVVVRCCRECLEFGYYEFTPGHNSRFDCRSCGSEDVIQT